MRLRRARLLISDPTVSIPVDGSGRTLWMRLSHNLPLLRSGNRLYDSIFERVAELLLNADAHLTMIDVGANIGDTTFLTNRVGDNCRFLCIEADTRHFPFLEKNTQHIKGVTRLRALVGDKAAVGNYEMHELHGTSYVVEGCGTDVPITSIDNLVIQYPDFVQTNLLKIDTDGFDAKVLRGAARLLAASKPIVIFELAPRHYVKAGKEEPNGVFDFLFAAGYTNIGLYNSSGHLMLYCDTSSPDALSCVRQLVNLAHFEGRYFDVVAFHSKHDDRFRHFMESERRVFAPPPPEAYQLT